MASAVNLDSDPEPTPSETQTPPPIPSSPPDLISGSSVSYRRRSSQRRNLNKLYDAEDTDSDKKTGALIHGAPTKEHRLLEYFLVISYGDSLQIRDRSPLMDIFENFSKRVHHHHAYIVSPQHRSSRTRKRGPSRRKSRQSSSTVSSTFSSNISSVHHSILCEDAGDALIFHVWHCHSHQPVVGTKEPAT